MATLDTTATLDTKKLIQDQRMTLIVKLHRLKQWRVRLWLGSLLIRLAAWIMWMDVEIETVESEQWP